MFMISIVLDVNKLTAFLEIPLEFSGKSVGKDLKQVDRRDTAKYF